MLSIKILGILCLSLATLCLVIEATSNEIDDKFVVYPNLSSYAVRDGFKVLNKYLEKHTEFGDKHNPKKLFELSMNKLNKLGIFGNGQLKRALIVVRDIATVTKCNDTVLGLFELAAFETNASQASYNEINLADELIRHYTLKLLEVCRGYWETRATMIKDRFEPNSLKAIKKFLPDQDIELERKKDTFYDSIVTRTTNFIPGDIVTYIKKADPMGPLSSSKLDYMEKAYNKFLADPCKVYNSQLAKFSILFRSANSFSSKHSDTTLIGQSRELSIMLYRYNICQVIVDRRFSMEEIVKAWY